jgi:hypothetical protein
MLRHCTCGVAAARQRKSIRRSVATRRRPRGRAAPGPQSRAQIRTAGLSSHCPRASRPSPARVRREILDWAAALPWSVWSSAVVPVPLKGVLCSLGGLVGACDVCRFVPVTLRVRSRSLGAIFVFFLFFVIKYHTACTCGTAIPDYHGTIVKHPYSAHGSARLTDKLTQRSAWPPEPAECTVRSKWPIADSYRWPGQPNLAHRNAASGAATLTPVERQRRTSREHGVSEK